MVVLQYLGVTALTHKLLNPQPVPPNPMEIIKPKLEQKPNNFQLKKPLSFIPAVSAAGDYQDLSAYVVINYDTGEVLAQKNMSGRLPIASLTKIMSAVVALDLASPDELFSVSATAANEIPTKVGFQIGNRVTLKNLLDAMLLTSANDAAQVVKEGIDQKYGSEVFIQAMNQKADSIGLKNSHFTNPQGFDNGNPFSSAEDLAILSKYALTQYPLIAEIVQKDYQFVPTSNTHRQMDLYNWNGLLNVYPGVFGVKIGNTDAAKMTTIVGAERAGKRVLVVDLGAPGIKERDLWAAQLLDIGFENLDPQLQPINVNLVDLQQKYSTWKYW